MIGEPAVLSSCARVFIKAIRDLARPVRRFLGTDSLLLGKNGVLEGRTFVGWARGKREVAAE